MVWRLAWTTDALNHPRRGVAAHHWLEVVVGGMQAAAAWIAQVSNVLAKLANGGKRLKNVDTASVTNRDGFFRVRRPEH